jgi:uncharacterized protein YjbI with pentapeptide repeats
LSENEVLIEITDKREPKQRLQVKNSDISNSEFRDCRAVDVIFDDISLTNVKVNYADLRNCKFTDMNMVDGNISNANLTGLTIDGANISGLTIRNAGAHQPLTFDNLEIEGSSLMVNDSSGSLGLYFFVQGCLSLSPNEENRF